MSSVGHATQLFLLALISLIGYFMLAVLHIHVPELEQLFREVVLGTVIGGAVAVPPRAAADVTVTGPVNVDAPGTAPTGDTDPPGAVSDL